MFMDQFNCPVILDEATHSPDLFFELKRRVDEIHRNKRKGLVVQELNEIMLKGGWPELYVQPELSITSYLNDLITTFIEKDIVFAAGIERKAAFTKTIALLFGRIGQLVNFSDIAGNIGVEMTTVQSWIAKLEQNALVRAIQPYYNNLNQRFIKTPKVYFEDVGLAVRFHGWSDFTQLYISPLFGKLLENLALTEIVRFFQNTGNKPEIFFVRTKEKVEVDFLVKLPNHKWIAIEIKSQPEDMNSGQIQLLEKTGLDFGNAG